MNTEQQAYINGFVKRAADYGYNQQEALTILKQAGGFFGGLGNSMDTGISNATQAVGNKVNQAGDYLKGLGNTAVSGMKDLGNRAVHAVADPVVKHYHRQVDPFVSGYKAFSETANAPYVPKPGQFDYKGPAAAPAAPAPTAPPAGGNMHRPPAMSTPTFA